MVNLVIAAVTGIDTVNTPFGGVCEALGGAAVYSSLAASIFTRTGLVSVVGEDFPEDHITFLNSKGIDTKGIETKPGKTFRWKAHYDYDMNQAHTDETELGVLAGFNPNVPEEYKKAEYLFLANNDPRIQRKVLDEVKPKFSALDTMNYWISNDRESLVDIIKDVDLILVNDAEARQLMGTHNLVKAAKQIISLGPQAVVVKKGEHGALLFTDSKHFACAAYPLEDVQDPTGAGDSFAGGMMGYIASQDEASEATLRKAVVYGSCVASYDAECFSIEKIKDLTRAEVDARFNEFNSITQF
ncbi:MAG: bifunctional hydroxymethylpyrimidine kinase/phosphomethylpyrimidine kinase [Candidatus Diapherotrites archaeon]|nr:bifunctional hydroxymethylpyrimidine kinase/phosphomethylpyrimidine kinase [Candidatus Diapherotrites archaeon]